jgi:hypothetical protein
MGSTGVAKGHPFLFVANDLTNLRHAPHIGDTSFLLLFLEPSMLAISILSINNTYCNKINIQCTIFTIVRVATTILVANCAMRDYCKWLFELFSYYESFFCEQNKPKLT